jgi:hypothetical protein
MGAAAPTSYNVASPLPRLESLSYLHFKTDGPCIHDWPDGKSAPSQLASNQGFPIFQKLVLFTQNSELFRQKSVLFIWNLMKKSESARSDFFQPIEFLNTASNPGARTCLQWRQQKVPYFLYFFIIIDLLIYI